MNKKITWLILGITIILIIILVTTKGLELCSFVGGLWCYPPASTFAKVLSVVITFLIIMGMVLLFLKLVEITIKGGKKR